MKWTKGRLKEKECLLFFLPTFPENYKPPDGYPENQRWDNITIEEKDWEDFFKYSEQGIEPEDMYIYAHDRTPRFIKPRGFHLLLEAKRWRGIFCDSTPSHRAEYEVGILEGTMPYWDILGGNDIPVPEAVKDYMKKSIFKGMDEQIIEDVYKLIKKSII